MTRSLTIAGFGAAALLVVACGDTNAPPEAATGTSSSSETNTSCAPSGTTVKVMAKDTMFDASCLAAPAGKAFTIDFDNEDPLPHNVAIYSADPKVDKNAKTLLQGTIVTGPKMPTYSVPSLAAGTYYFQCDVHPQMHGTFVVK